MNISADHPDAENPLLEACARTLRTLGAEVCVRHGADNALRACDRGARHAFAPRAPAPWNGERPAHELAAAVVARIEVEGLANLLHELVHVALAGELADDHGYDYGAIPYDVCTATGRAILWEEIACCVVSCAYLAAADSRADMHAWFAEQLGIQPVFYGMEDRPDEFFALVDALARDRGDELATMLACAYERVDRLLAPSRVALPVRRIEFVELWTRWRFDRGAAA